MKKTTFLLSILILFVLTSCNNGNNKDRLILTNITGEPNEVLVVINKTSWLEGNGNSLKKCLEEPYYGLPQYESSFKAIQIEKTGFNNMFQLYRNIIEVNISSTVKTTKIWFGNDVYARPQAYLKIEAKNGLEFSELIHNNSEKIKAFFKNAEVERLQKAYKNRFSVDIMAHLKEKFDINLEIPANYKLEKDSSNFSWISFETPQMSQGIFVYSYPYQDTSLFSLENLLLNKDSMLKKYVEGPNPNSYMQTEHEFPTRRTIEINKNGIYTAFLEGLWRVEGDFMGGPFITYAFPNKDNTRIICVDAYVYNPKKDKRNFIMQLEAVIKTAKYK